MNENTGVLTSLNSDELRALAESNLAPTRQSRLDELLSQNRDGYLDHPRQGLDVCWSKGEVLAR